MTEPDVFDALLAAKDPLMVFCAKAIVVSLTAVMAIGAAGVAWWAFTSFIKSLSDLSTRVLADWCWLREKLRGKI